MKRLGRASDTLFVLALVLLAIALIATIKLLLKIAFIVLAVSFALVIVKRRAAKRRRSQT